MSAVHTHGSEGGGLRHHSHREHAEPRMGWVHNCDEYGDRLDRIVRSNGPSFTAMEE